MSTPNNSVNNQTGTSGTTAFHNHLRSASGQWHRYNDTTDTHGYYSGVGSPEGVVAADIGSIYTDTGAGASGVYYKTSDVANTGWELIPSIGAQTIFHAFLSAQDSNVTGAGASYTFGSGNALTVTQVGTGMATNGVFTAPSTGWYTFGCRLSIGGISLMTDGSLLFNYNAGAAFYQVQTWHPTNWANASAQESVGGVLTLFMTAGDTMSVFLMISTGVGNSVDIIAAAPGSSYFWGFQNSSSAGISGVMVKSQEVITSGGVRTISQIPMDGTIPQNTEGSSYLTIAYTPLSATNNLRIEVYSGSGSTESAAETLNCSICQVGVANSLVAGAFANNGLTAIIAGVYLSITVSAGSTLARTYDWRVGNQNGAGFVGINNYGGGGNFFGAAGVATIRVTEYTP